MTVYRSDTGERVRAVRLVDTRALYNFIGTRWAPPANRGDWLLRTLGENAIRVLPHDVFRATYHAERA